jgi:predicted transcriptional regulator
MVQEQDRKLAVMQALANNYMRKILLSTISHAKPVEEIARENGIPVSTCYRSVHELIKLHLLRVEKTIITDSGKKFETVRSLVKDALVTFSQSGEFTVEVTLVPREPDERLAKIWESLRRQEMPQIITA